MRNGDLLSVHGQGHGLVVGLAHRSLPPKQMPARQTRSSRCSRIISGKCLVTDWMGAGAICPSPQMEVRRSTWERSLSIAMSSLPTLPRRPVLQQVDQLLRADPARGALPAGFIAIEADGGQRHIEHAGAVRADDHGARAQHRSQPLDLVPVERRIQQRRRQIAGGGSRRREANYLPARRRSAGIVIDQAAIGGPHGHLEDARPDNISGHAHELDSGRPRQAGIAVPLAAFAQDGHRMRECLHVVQRCRRTPQAAIYGTRRLVARLGAIALDGLHQAPSPRRRCSRRD